MFVLARERKTSLTGSEVKKLKRILRRDGVKSLHSVLDDAPCFYPRIGTLPEAKIKLNRQTFKGRSRC